MNIERSSAVLVLGDANSASAITPAEAVRPMIFFVRDFI
jgi:hypothetical protein